MRWVLVNFRDLVEFKGVIRGFNEVLTGREAIHREEVEERKICGCHSCFLNGNL